MKLYDERKSLAAGFLCLVMMAAILFIRNFYSFSWADESLYIAEIHRLFLGGRPFVDEWHPTQFYAILFVPFYHIYTKLSGGHEGVYLLARYFYLLLAFLTASYVFYIFKMKTKLRIQYCISSGILVMLYSWANVMGISYHNIFFLAVTTASMLVIKVIFDQEKMSRRQCWGYSVVVGVFAGVSVITIPTAIIVIGILFLVFFIYVFIKRLYGKIKVAVGIVCGMALDAIFYIGFVLSRVSIADLLKHIGYLFQDKDHEVKSFSGYYLSLTSLLYVYGNYVLLLICAAVCVRFILFVAKKDNDSRVRDILYFISVPVLIYSLYAYANSHMSTYIILGLYAFFLFILFAERSWLEDKEFITAISVLWIAGCVMVGAFLFASATSGPMSTGFVCFSLITLMVLDRKTKELRGKYRIIAGIAVAGILFAMLGMTGIARVKSVYRDAPLSALNTRLERGPGRGLITTAEHAEQYNACMEVIDYINEMEQGTGGEGSIIVSKLAPWIYTGLDIQNGAPTAWTCEISNPNIETYYCTHDIGKLKYVLVLREEFGGYIGAGNPEGTYLTPNQNYISGWLGNILEDAYAVKSFECGTLYIRKDI